MCGIVAYIGKKNATPILINGLKRLLYRGYDSFGFAVMNEKNDINYFKKPGRLDEEEKSLSQLELKGNLGEAHSRWSTHGPPTEANAHPHPDCKKEIFLVHNGIIENYVTLKEWLKERGHLFRSETDSEVLSHLIEEHYNGDLLKAVQKALSLVEGTYGLGIISKHEPDTLIGARKGSPLAVGVVKNGEYILASDPAAIIEHTKKVVYLDDGEVVKLTRSSMRITNLENKKVQKQAQEIQWDLEQIEKAGFDHLCLKKYLNNQKQLPMPFEDALWLMRIEYNSAAYRTGLTS